MNELLGGYKLKIQLTEQAINWFKDELDLPDNNKVYNSMSATVENSN